MTYLDPDALVADIMTAAATAAEIARRQAAAMQESASVPAGWHAIFQHDNLPGHSANVLINHAGQPKVNPAQPEDEEIPWPVFAGIEAMPMSGRFLVRAPDGSLSAYEDGFLVVGADGHPRWQADPPS